MTRIIYDAATTLNGFLADDTGSLDWLFAVEGGEHPEAELFPADAAVLVEGSSTYEWVLAHEHLLENPERWAELYGSKPTFVFTSRDLPIPAGADVRLVSGSVADAFPAIEAAAVGGDVWVVGGGELAGQFLDAGLLDVVAVSVAPVALAGGAPLLPRRLESDRLRLVSATAVGQFARLVYEVGRA
jgi:dihydrofolate reductase